MKTLLFFLLNISLILNAQSATLTASASPSTVRPGQSTTITLSLSGIGVVAGIQWTLGLPVGWNGTPSLSAGPIGAGKQLSCGPGTCFIWGLNVNALSSGTMVTIPIAIPSNSVAGPQSISLTGLFAGSPAGVSVPLTGVNTTVTVLSPFDITGDGQVTAADVNAIVAQVASGTCPSDVVGNSQCNILQIIAEVIGWAAAGSKP